MKTLVLAEKPSVGRDIARVLNCTRSNRSYIEGSKYVVTWALGHLVTLADPDYYGDKYKSWRIEDLPIKPKQYKLVTIKQTSAQFNVVKGLLNRNDINEIVIATDAGREGELVARWIIEKANVKKRIKRLWISSVTDKAIKDGFNNLKDGKLYENLYQCAVARSEADWVVGINATRALTCHYGASLSCGRVQTPTVHMINRRQDEILNFRAKAYYKVIIRTPEIDLIYNGNKMYDEEKVNKLVEKIKAKNKVLINVKKADKKTSAPKLYDLTELQRDANRLYGFSAKGTLSVIQSLYEYHKVLTYPRTDSRYLTKDILPTLKERIRSLGNPKYNKVSEIILKQEIKSSKSFIDDAKVSDHHAIIPTEVKARIGNFNQDELKIYDLVVKRFLAVLLPAFTYLQTKIETSIDNLTFSTSGKIVKDLGWKKVYSKEEEFEDVEDSNDVILPNIANGSNLTISDVYYEEYFTKPPSPFTEGTLLGAMENPIKFIETNDKELVAKMGEVGGIGTVATRADIIEKLLKNFLIEKRENKLYITSKGRQLLNLVPNDLKSPLLTAKWEKQLSLIEKGKLRKSDFVKKMELYADELVHDIKGSKKLFKHDNLSSKKCPECGKILLEVNGKHGQMLVCQDRECKYRENVFKVTNSRCPKCHKKLNLAGVGDKQIFTCQCGYREKLSAFKKRKEESADGVNKRQVGKFMQEQEKEQKASKHNPFADLLSKYKK